MTLSLFVILSVSEDELLRARPKNLNASTLLIVIQSEAKNLNASTEYIY